MGANSLVIVESPAKAKTIGKMLGGKYQIFASMGHIRDLPEHSFGVDVKNHFAPKYVESKSRAGVIRQLRSAAKKADHIYLAPDPDREGEAIAWHLQEVLKDNTKADFLRVTFHEITKSAIARAFQQVGKINLPRVDSQQARRILDRLVGYQISPLLWSQIEKGISAGRVQSVALRLVVEREREILAFQPQEYWNFLVTLHPDRTPAAMTFHSKLAKIDGEKFLIDNAADANRTLDAIRNAAAPFRVAVLKSQPRRRNAPPPFITSTLQQAAGSFLGFSANRTMRVAQSLYEGIELGDGSPVGMITYMRTDSVTIAREAQETARQFINANYGASYVPEKPNFYKSKAGAQEAHEAIRPTDVDLTPDRARPFLDDAQYKLYNLIWRRFLASQMAQARQQQTTAEMELDGADRRCYLFRTTATVTTFPGFLAVYKAGEQGGEEPEDPTSEILGQLRVGDQCELKQADHEQKFTEPPPRFSEASLIRELESNGIGRPSTYATIVNTIQERLYVTKEQGRLKPSELGFKVNDFLVQMLPELFQVGFTAGMETKLDEIEEGKLEWTAMLEDFYRDFEQWLQAAKSHGAPESNKVETMIQLLEDVKTWAPAEKRGSRKYDDHKFLQSVKDQFVKDRIITAKQWQALLTLAVNYRKQLPELDRTAEQAGFQEELAEAEERFRAMRQKQSAEAVSSEQEDEYRRIFAHFDGLVWAEPETRRGRTYDDRKMFESLKKQALGGKKLSEKQLAVIVRFAEKYRDKITAFAALSTLLRLDASQEKADSAPADPEIVAIMARMSKITQWQAPVTKGKRAYDDKSFFASLKQQFASGRQLSPNQVFALKKMDRKYFGPTGS
ncbi:MAG: type I DNA topoisomerase [Victivallales bacterium]|nr:type I DNA topoisomerase [Victivallales bacterium]